MTKPTKDNPRIVYVKKASQWCKTYFDENGKQVQEWSMEKPLKIGTEGNL